MMEVVFEDLLFKMEDAIQRRDYETFFRLVSLLEVYSRPFMDEYISEEEKYQNERLAALIGLAYRKGLIGLEESGGESHA